MFKYIRSARRAAKRASGELGGGSRRRMRFSADDGAEWTPSRGRDRAVSYTHLTLPTICSV
eukprot:11976463-Alexandrium_andersonii.AAC.1